jgi:hypothetical protein
LATSRDTNGKKVCQALIRKNYLPWELRGWKKKKKMKQYSRYNFPGHATRRVFMQGNTCAFPTRLILISWTQNVFFDSQRTTSHEELCSCNVVLSTEKNSSTSFKRHNLRGPAVKITRHATEQNESE